MMQLDLKLGRGLIDETGHRYGSLLVLRRVGVSFDGQACWLCRCDCGGESMVRSYDLRAGRSARCFECNRRSHVVDESGKRYGALVVGDYAGNGAWSCRCDCGADRTVAGSELRRGNATACKSCVAKRRNAPRPHMRGKRFGGPAKCGSHCGICCDLAWRIVGPKCRGCGAKFAPEPAYLVPSGITSSVIVRCWE